MAWPESRLTTYTPASPVKSADLNAIQDAIIARSHGDLVDSIPAGEWRPQGAVWVGPAGGQVALGVTVFQLALRYPIGTKLKTLTIDMIGNGATDVTVEFHRRLASAVDNLLDTFTFNNIAAVWAAQVCNLTDTIIAAGETYYLKASVDQAGASFGGSYLTLSKP